MAIGAIPTCWSPVRSLADDLERGCRLQSGPLSLQREGIAGNRAYILTLYHKQRHYACAVRAVFMFIYYTGGAGSICITEPWPSKEAFR